MKQQSVVDVAPEDHLSRLNQLKHVLCWIKTQMALYPTSEEATFNYSTRYPTQFSLSLTIPNA